MSPLRRTWTAGDQVRLDLPLPVRFLRPHSRVRSWRGQIALARGPLVYCLESVDNPGLDLFGARLDATTLHAKERPDLLDGVWAVTGQTTGGAPVTANYAKEIGADGYASDAAAAVIEAKSC